MKSIYCLLLAAFFSCTGHHKHKGALSKDFKTLQTVTNTGKLSDIAAEIIAIPLETPPGIPRFQPTQVRLDASDLFLLSNRQLFHFDRSGKFQNTYYFPVTPQMTCVQDYIVDNVRKQLIVLDNHQRIYYYAYDGTLYQEKKLESMPWNKLIKLSFYKDSIWATTENITVDAANPANQYYEKRLYRLDRSFAILQAITLKEPELGRFCRGGYFTPKMAIAGNYIYVHSPALEGDKLDNDTLYLLANRQIPIASGIHLPPVVPNSTSLLSGTDLSVCMLPVCISSRFLLSSYRQAHATKNNYLFCYDLKKQKSYCLPKGFEDNFYGTGYVPELLATDIYHSEFYYCKTGQETRDVFPQRDTKNSQVLFLLKLKA